MDRRKLLLKMSGTGVVSTIIDDMTVFWFMNEASGSRRNAIDQTNTLLDTGTAPSANGHASFVLADSDYITVADNAAFGVGADTSFTWTLKIKPTAVNVFQWIFGKSDGNNNRHEYVLYLTDDGKLNFRVGNGSTFQTLTTTSAISAGSTYQVTIGHDSVNDVLSIKVNDGAIKTAAWTGGTYAAGTTNLSFGRIGAVDSNYYGGEIWDAGFWLDRYLIDAEQLSIYNLAYPYGLTAYNLSEILPSAVGSQHSWFDFSDSTVLFTDAAKTTNVASDDDPIRAVADKFSVSTGLLAPGDAVRPLWKTNIQNSLACGLWNGTDSQLDETVWAAGSFTAFYVVKNLDASYGSHIASPDNYAVVTGASYDADPRFVIHQDGGAESIGVSLVAGAGFNILEVVKNGTAWAVYCNGFAGTPAALVNEFLPSTIGPDLVDPGSDWWANMYLAERVRYTAALDAKTRAGIRYQLAQKWGISPVVYQPYVPA